jgi:glycosyltransferase involved in cell wall biosynthesis
MTTSTPSPAAADLDWPLVSVVLPTRGRPELVRDSIRAVVEQSYPGEIECFVVHDQEPADRSLAELGRPGRTVTVIENDGAPGLAGARNVGLQRVKGEFVASCDDDDTWHPTKVEKQVRRFRTDPDVIVLGTGIRLILPGGRTADWAGRADRITYRTLLRNRVKELHSSTLMMRRDAFAKAGQYDETLPHGYAEDYDFVLRAARVGRVGVVREPLADIRKDGQSYYRGRAENTTVALRAFLAKHTDIASDRRGHARMLGQLAFAESSIGHRTVATQLALRSVARWPFSPHPYVALLQITTRLEPARIARLARRFGRGMA